MKCGSDHFCYSSASWNMGGARPLDLASHGDVVSGGVTEFGILRTFWFYNLPVDYCQNSPAASSFLPHPAKQVELEVKEGSRFWKTKGKLLPRIYL